MSDFMEYAEYYKKAWEQSLKDRTNELQDEIKTLRAENARLKAENAKYREAIAAVLISHIAEETLKGGE